MAWGDHVGTGINGGYLYVNTTATNTAGQIRVDPALRQPASMAPLTEVEALRRRVDDMCADGRRALERP